MAVCLVQSLKPCPWTYGRMAVACLSTAVQSPKPCPNPNLPPILISRQFHKKKSRSRVASAMYPVPGFGRLDGDERLRASAMPRHGGQDVRAVAAAAVRRSASASHTAHPRFHTKLDKGGAKNMHPWKSNQPCRFHRVFCAFVRCPIV